MPATHTPVTWALDGTVARLGSARLDLESSATGIAVDSLRGTDHLLGIDLRAPVGMAAALADRWVRGDDIVAVYQPADPRRLEATAMWRSITGFRNAWELVLSAQTAVVESDPSLAVTCDVSAGEVIVGREIEGRLQWSPLGSSAPFPRDATCLAVCRSADAVLVAVHPADARRVVVVDEGVRLRIACWLFSAAIEKGVLLRGRVLAAIGPAGDDMRWADALVTAFAASPPPLTT